DLQLARRDRQQVVDCRVDARDRAARALAQVRDQALAALLHRVGRRWRLADALLPLLEGRAVRPIGEQVEPGVLGLCRRVADRVAGDPQELLDPAARVIGDRRPGREQVADRAVAAGLQARHPIPGGRGLLAGHLVIEDLELVEYADQKAA